VLEIGDDSSGNDDVKTVLEVMDES